MKNNSYNSNNNGNSHNTDITDSIILDSLQYQSPVSNHEFKIDSENNLHILEQSILKDRRDTVPLDLINPQPIIKNHLDKNLILLALASVMASSIFFISAIYMGHLWPFSFALVFGLFGIGSIVTAQKSRTKIFQYQFVNTNSPLFTLHVPSTKKVQVEFFVNALNKRIIAVNKKSENNGNVQSRDNKFVSLQNSNDEREIYTNEKYSQYIKHLDFLFNHGIVDEVLYKKLQGKINSRIVASENRFTTEEEKNSTDIQFYGNNIINFPINA